MKIPSLSVSSIPGLSRLEMFASTVVHGGVLGIDIGSSSAKIVQLSTEGGTVKLDTYGEIELGPFGDRDARKAVHLTTTQIAEVILEVLSGADAKARRGGISIPLSATLINVVELPKRDIEQMEKIIASEVKPLIPVPLDTVILNWFVLSDEHPVETSIAVLEDKAPVEIPKEKVMLIATEKEIVNAYSSVAENDGISVDFLEVEFFSAARACMADARGPALVMDFGATSTKLYAMNGRGMVVATHSVSTGGEAITGSIMKATDWNFEKAEDAKRAHGLVHGTDPSTHDLRAVSTAVEGMVSAILDETSRFVEEMARDGGVDIQKIILVGGGSLMSGITERVHKHFKIETVLAQPFNYAQVPIILEDVVKEVGPKFAVAMGVALRAIGK